MKKKQLLIIDKHPFGTLVDVVKWCQYSKEKYEITLMCFDDNIRTSMPGVRIIRIDYRGNYIKRGLRFIYNVIKYIKKFKGPIFLVYFEGCGIIKKFFLKRKIHVDIRTLSVAVNGEKRSKYDKRLVKECSLFDSISTLSNGVRDKIGIAGVKILPLGADVISDTEKKYTDSINLLYVGTFNNRNLSSTIEGFDLFRKKNPNVAIKYDIIGSGQPQEIEKIKAAIKATGCKDVVMHGRIEYNRLGIFFDTANVGVSFVPITDYYLFQPPTKTYEYIRSGLFCIATNTPENAKIIKPNTGVLINDNAEEFARGIECYYKNRKMLNFKEISASLDNHSWKYIVNNYFFNIVDNLED